MLANPSPLTHDRPALRLLTFGRPKPPLTWTDMMRNEIGIAEAALDAVRGIDTERVPHGSLLELLVECRTLARRAGAVCDQERTSRHRQCS
jgi:hypothetical protein